ncbi:acyl CoA:acetate/3-ketoacid CoA transferase [Hahella ganghwensis]|uniref:acyl CoA:acetate/3-ketoacid CoA transferase n=1 Tax=Hahella ganghwensis TaxID=286420 RepID=UPI00037677E8|nr:acyl CoA:acetate/3-ketoacid CoA transferase [Hahella ganghwensis]
MSSIKHHKLVSPTEAAALIPNGATIATAGFVGIGFAEELAIAVEQRFLQQQTPGDLTLVYAAGQGDGKERGLNHFGHDGMVKRVIGGHWGLVPKLGALACDGKLEAYNLPQGVISHLFRDIAAGKPGLLTQVGLHTFVDPRYEGGKINQTTREELVELMHIGGEEYLFYKTFPIHIALLRGTTADPKGNITGEREALPLESLAIAQAVHNCGGKVIVQVERLTDRHRLHPGQVTIPGILVDHVVLAPPEHHQQTFAETYNPAYSGEIHESPGTCEEALNLRTLIARRAAMELRRNAIINLGIGMPEEIANVAYREAVLDQITLTIEPGGIGGRPAGGLSFGAVSNAEAIIDQPAQFDFYDGGGIDQAFLGMAQMDAQGNVNVSRFGNRMAGAGGFINISQNAKEVFFLGTFCAGSPQPLIENGEIRMNGDNKKSKLVHNVEHLTFSGQYALRRGQKIKYITERCVFQLTTSGVELTEVAPGVQIDRDILPFMGFKPLISPQLSVMPIQCLKPGPIDLTLKPYGTLADRGSEVSRPHIQTHSQEAVN